METYPKYFGVGTWSLGQAKKQDREAFHHSNDRDLVYTGINAKMVKAFLVVKTKKRVKDDGRVILASVSDIKKYNDAIKCGSIWAGKPLSSSYYRQMNVFIQAYKKEYKSTQKNRQTDKQEAGPIMASLFCYICAWAVGAGDIFLWAYCLAMWNLMS